MIEAALEAVNEARFLLLSKEIDPHTGWEALDAVPSISTRTALSTVERRPHEELEQVLTQQTDVILCDYVCLCTNVGCQACGICFTLRRANR